MSTALVAGGDGTNCFIEKALTSPIDDIAKNLEKLYPNVNISALLPQLEEAIMDELLIGKIPEIQKTKLPPELPFYINRVINPKFTSDNKELDKLRVLFAEKQFSEDEFIEVINSENLNHPICISASSGSGKTCLLAELGRKLQKKDPDKIIIYLSAQKLIEELKLFGRNIGKESIIQAIQNISCSNELGKLFLQSQLNSSENIAELMLSLDEYSEDETLIIQTLQIISKIASIRLWFTCHPKFQEKLGTDFNQINLNLEPLTLDNQLKLLASYWNSSEKLDKRKLTYFARHCLQAHMSNLDSSDKEVIGIPLQCFLIAEAYQKHAIEYVKSDKPLPKIKNSNLANLYDMFVQKKIGKYKMECKLDDNELIIAYAIISLEQIFPHDFRGLEGIFKPIDKQEISKAAIINSENTRLSQFVHSSFAEYFIAWMLNNWKLCVLNYGEAQEKLGQFLFTTVFKVEEKCSQISGRKCITYNFIHSTISHFLNEMVKSKTSNFKPLFASSQNFSVEDKCKLANALVPSSLLNLFRIFLKTNNFNEAHERIFDDTLLLVASKNASLRLLKKIIKRCKAKWESTPKLQRDVLFVAVERGEFSIVEYLLNEKGLKSNLENLEETYSCILHTCVAETKDHPPPLIEQKLQLINVITSINATLLDSLNSKGRTPIFTNSIHIRLLLELIRLGSNVSLFFPNNETLFHLHPNRNYSADEYHSLLASIPTETLTELVHMKGENGDTPLMRLIQYFNPKPETLDLFKTIEADFNSCDSEGNSILSSAVINGRNQLTIKTLIKNGSDYKWLGTKKESLLHLAAKFGNVEAVEYLIKEKLIEINLPDEEQRTPLNYAIQHQICQFDEKRYDTAMALHRNGGVLKEIINYKGRTILQDIAVKKNIPSLKFFFETGWDRNILDEFGNSLLHLIMSNEYLVAEVDFLNATKFLLENGADPNKLNYKGESALHHALRNEDTDWRTIRLLLKVTKFNWDEESARLGLKTLYKTKDEMVDNQEFLKVVEELEKIGGEFDPEEDYDNDDSVPYQADASPNRRFQCL